VKGIYEERPSISEEEKERQRGGNWSPNAVFTRSANNKSRKAQKI